MPQRLLELFMENGGKLEAQNADGSTLLHLAARNNKVQLIPFLLVNGCDIEAQDKVDQYYEHVTTMANNIIFRMEKHLF